VQKHAASRLHFDLRLEIGGAMKSWAVPKGPSLDPAVRRLAVEVEDHPIEYNTFEGTIPRGEYGGGTVMLWDRGTYEADDPRGEVALRAGLHRGELKFTLHGERLRGSFALVRTRSAEDKPQWLLIKHRDTYARPGSDVVARVTTSVATGRTMEEIAAAGDAVWRSNRVGSSSPIRHDSARRSPSRNDSGSNGGAALAAKAFAPMLATPSAEVPAGAGWAFEPKYDGIRVVAVASGQTVALLTRNGNDKAAQFPEVAAAVRALAARRRRPCVLDGEIVALSADGSPARFQDLQGRIHFRGNGTTGRTDAAPAALIAFDVLLDGTDVLLAEPWRARRRRLEALLRKGTSDALRLGESLEGEAAALLDAARARGWEGIIAKREDAPYQPGRRSRAWLKLKVEMRQEFVVGGYTEPRKSREHLGALLLGYFDGDRLIYAGHTGGGFTREGLRAMSARLARLTRKTSPFAETPATNEPAHWVRPEVVVEVKFNEWTAEGKLRQPIFLGVRDDKDARDVRRERPSTAGRVRRPPSRRAAASPAAPVREVSRAAAPASRAPAGVARIVRQLEEMEAAGGNGVVALGGGASLEVSNLGKVFFPEVGGTKGDLMRYYARVSRWLLPAIDGRPLVLKRFPNGVGGPAFYQQRAPEAPPPGVRVATVEGDGEEGRSRLVGGGLLTLLYLVQLGAISVDPWHSRIESPDHADYSIVDLDPGPRAPFRRVVDVARRVKEELDALGLAAVVKTSGASGLHVVLPLAPRTPNDAARLVAELVATRVAERHPRDATVVRGVKDRKPTAVYVDYLQNIRGKTVAGVYSARAEPSATVSTPLDWAELTDDLDPRGFTIETVPSRVAQVGDLWAAGMRRKNDLKKVLGRVGTNGN
jgi:bifunctional non-homologous end joining protein LigD